MPVKTLFRFTIAVLFFWKTDIDSLNAQWTCGFDRMHQQRMAEDPEYRNRVAQLEAQLYEHSKEYYGQGVKSRSKPNYILPVVVHLVVPPGTPVGQGNHLTDLQVEQGLQFLNQAFANQGPFQTANGVDAGIQFCLARRDPNGMPTNGITRTESALVNDPMCAPGTNASSDGAIKQLVNWDCRRYINIWLVTDLFNANFGCGLAGYAYFPGAPCSVDGIVQESRYWNTVGGTRITAHEMGHYFSLNHTFNGGCANADCLLDGDRVCDTPPDNSPSFAPCNTNSCNTDLPDLPDDNANYMDYSGCGPVHFTDGQRVRMIAGLENGRASLINSNACLPPGDYDAALIQLQTGPDLCVDSLCIQLTIRNDGLKTFSAIPVDYRVDGVAQPVYNWSGILNPGQTAQISLPCMPVAPGIHDLDLRLGDPDNQSDFYLSNNSRRIQFEIYPLLFLSLDSLTPTHCISDGTIAVKASGGTSPYTYRISNHAYAQTDPYFQLLIPGRYTVTVRDTHQCQQTLIVDVPDSCQDVRNKRFITNRDARSLGNDCYLLTEALNFQSGSVWYEDKVDLRQSFDIYFDLNLGCIDGAGADGIAFVFQPISTSIGVAGGGLGYQNIMPSLAVEFDSWENNNFGDPPFDHLSIMKNGNVAHGVPDNLAGPVGILPGNPNVEDCRFHKALIRWNASEQLLMVYVDCNLRLSYRGDVIQSVFNSDPLVYFGFTAATGSAVNVQQICLNYISGVTKLEDQTICDGGSIQVSAAPKFSRYRWSPATGVSNVDIQNPIFKPDSTTTYFIRYEDNCGFAYQDSFTLFVKKVDLDYDLQLLDSCGNFSGALLRLKTDPLDTSGLFAFNGIRFSKDSIFEIAEPGRYTIYRKLGSCIVSKIIDVAGFQNRLRDSLIWIQGLDCRDSGRVVVQALEGIPPYQYRIDGGLWQNSGVFGGLAPGNHLIEIRDQTSCAIQRNVDIARFVNRLDLKIDSAKLDLSCCQPDAYIRVNASGSWPYYYYSLDQQSWSADGYYGALTPGFHRIVARDEFGCQSDTLQFDVRDFRGVSIDTQRLRICKGEFVQVGPVRYDSTGQYEYTFSNRYCCDSIIRTELIVDPVYAIQNNQTICRGDSIQVGNKFYSIAGQYVDSLTSLQSCDSVIQTRLTVLPVYEQNQSYRICNGDRVQIGAKYYDRSGLFTDTLQTINGCDSVIHADIVVHPTHLEQNQHYLCKGQSLTIGTSVYQQTGSYVDRLQNRFGCDSIILTDLLVDTVLARLNVDSISCFGETDGRIEILPTRGIPEFTYAWEDPTQYGDGSVFDQLPPGAYRIYIRDSLGCEENYQVILLQPMELLSNLPVELKITLGDRIRLQPLLNFIPSRVEWTPAAGLSCADCLEPEVLPLNDAEYTGYYEDANGCFVTARVRILVNKQTDVYVPNVFSPNGDQINDWVMVFGGASIERVAEFKIFDRWGELVFVNRDFQVNDPLAGWDGMFKGSPMAPGVFIYSLKALRIDGSEIRKAGDVTLIR